MAKTSKKNCTHPRYARYGKLCTVCDTEVGFAPEPKSIPAGVYRLNTAIDNTAGKDGRSSDWTKFSEIPAGTYYVKANHRLGINDVVVPYGVTVVKRGERDYLRVEPQHPAYDAVVEALAPAVATDGEFVGFEVWSRHGDVSGTLLQLLKSGKISREDISAAMQADHDEEN